mmetsp:Transcript_20429/g.31190  ORF Transcript_20429/g.31190 Transcript_20429/m.31190 type:complete len:110 (+) Transcript_20429:53-382(+)
MTGISKIFHYKLVLLGDTAVGKSCLVVRFVRDEFFEFQEPTIGAAFLTQSVVLDNSAIKFEIWDTAGQGTYLKSFSNSARRTLSQPCTDVLQGCCSRHSSLRHHEQGIF